MDRFKGGGLARKRDSVFEGGGGDTPIHTMFIYTYSYSYLQKVVIGRFLNLLFDSAGEI